jgi:DnaJ-domain-containing protein 1
MAKKRSSPRRRQAEWWELFAEHAASFVVKAAGEIFKNWGAEPKASKKRVSGPARGPASRTAMRKPRKPPAWWKVLEVAPTASEQEIKASYRNLMSGTHPDKVSHLSVKLQKAAEREAKKLNTALDEALKRRS